jgi:hypothetical protein
VPAVTASPNPAGFVWQSQLNPDSGYLTGILGPAVVFTIGGAFFFMPLTSMVTSGIPRADAGAAAGLMNTAKQVGGAVGLAGLVTLTGHSGGDNHTTSHTTQALAETYGNAFLAMAAILVAIAVLAWLLPAHDDTTLDARADDTAEPPAAGPT